MASQADFSTIAELFDASIKRFGPRSLFCVNKGRVWEWTTYAEFGAFVTTFRNGLHLLGIRHGDRVGIISNNSVEWAAAAYACYSLGAVFVPMYETQPEKEWEFILLDCGAKALLVTNGAMYHKVMLHALEDPKRALLCQLQWINPLDSDLFRSASDASLRSFPPMRPSREDTACLIYTSGTTGNPKGVVLTHGNICSNIAGVRDLGIVTEEDRSLSFLPWAHAMGHTCELHGLVHMGATIAICSGVEHLVTELSEVRPTVLFAVPRIFNKIYNGVRAQMEAKPRVVRALFSAGLAAAKKKRVTGSLGIIESATLALADRLVFSKIRAKFGGRLRLAISGAAALSPDVAEFIDALGIKVYEGYGLSETSPIVSANYPGNRKLGSVGKPIPGVRVTIDRSLTNDPENGEIVVYGPNVMQGYFNRPEETAAALTRDGGLRTGDLGRVDEDGYIFITGRIKEQYKLENGKYVVPGPLEEQLKLSPLIANVMVYGDNRPYNVALVVPDMAGLTARVSKEGLADAGDLLADERVKKIMMAEIDRLSAEFKGYERIKKITLAAEDFTQENGMLTPTLKLKRRNVLAKWGEAIERLYE